jgi:hypothetical protein
MYRLLRRAYPSQLQALRHLQHYLTAGHVEWPLLETAATVVAKADELLDLTQILKSKGEVDEFRLVRDEAWIREVRAQASRILNTGDEPTTP